MVLASPKYMPIRKLSEGDCFFWSTPGQRLQRENELLALREWRIYGGMEPMTFQEERDYYSVGTSSYIVEAIVRATGERCVRRLSDNTFWIWYDGSQVVQFSPDRASFLARVEDIKKAAKKLAEEQQRMSRSRSRKERKAESEVGL